MTVVVVENEEMEEAVPISSNTEGETSSRETQTEFHTQSVDSG